MADPDLPMNGANAKIVLFYGQQRVPGIDGYCQRWSVKEVATKFRDPIVGRKRKRADKKVDGYDADLDVIFATMEAINFLVSIDTKRENNEPLKELAIGLEFNQRTGGKEGVILGKATASWDYENPGQSDRLKGKISIEAETYSALAL